MLHRFLTIGSALLLFSLAPGAVSAQKADDSDRGQPRQKRASADDRDQKSHAFLGVLVAPVHPAMGDHLKEQLAPGQGLFVDDVVDDSPADKAGLEHGDILATFDDQRLYSPEQFIGLVRSKQAGDEVSLGVIHRGEQKTVKAKLEPLPGRGQPRGGRRAFTLDRNRDNERNGDSDHWNIFDSMTITQVDKNKFKAEIAYRDKDGKVEKRQFEGTRDELRRDIEQQKDLPASEREHLLSALGLGQNDMDDFFPFWGPDPRWFNMPPRY